jgi:iron uptake system EfeUOB component EfeO/EfeM
MRRLSSILLIAFALLVSGLSLTSAEANTGDTEHYVAKTDQFAEIDLGKKGPSQGDQLVFHDDLRDRHHDDAGELNGTCTATHVKGRTMTMQCLVTASLDDGDLTVHGITQSDDRRATLAVTGGTDDYSDASGEVHVKFVSDTKTLITVDLN